MMWLVYSLLAAVSFGLRGILYQRSSKMPVDRNLMLFGVYLSGTVIALILAVAAGQTWTPANFIGLLMGSVSFIANASIYKGFAVGKASLVAILSGLTPMIVGLGGYLLYGEKLNAGQTVCFVIIVGGLVLLRYSGDLSLKQLGGAQWGLIAMFMFGANDLASKGAMLLKGDVYPTLFFMFVTGSAWFYLFWLRARRRSVFLGGDAAAETAASAAVVGWSKTRTVGWGMIVGLTNVSGMILILLAFREGIAGLVSAITAVNVLLIIGYARVFLKEKFKRLEVAGIVLTFAGITLLRVLG